MGGCDLGEPSADQRRFGGSSHDEGLEERRGRGPPKQGKSLRVGTDGRKIEFYLLNNMLWLCIQLFWGRQKRF